jgi:hypothetical protein
MIQLKLGQRYAGTSIFEEAIPSSLAGNGAAVYL